MIRTRFLKRPIPPGIILIPMNPITPVQSVIELLELPAYNPITPVQSVIELLELPAYNPITPVQSVIGVTTLLP